MNAFLRKLFLRGRVKKNARGDTIMYWGQDEFTWDNILAGGLLCCGMTGAGKSSTFLQMAQAMMASNCSFLVLTAKPSDVLDWYRVWKKMHRYIEWVHVHPSSGHRINLLHYEMTRPGGSPHSAAILFQMLNDIAMRSQGSGNNEASFWVNLFYVLIHAGFTLAQLAKKVPTIADVYRIIQSVPTSIEQATSDSWTRHSECGKALAAASHLCNSPAQERLLRRSIEVLLHEIPTIGERARGAAISMINGILAKFLSEPWHDILCCSESNLLPESLFTGPHGKLVVLDFPVLVHGDAGRFFQILYMMLVQSACLRRDVRQYPRPVIVVRDECQLYCHGEWDARVQSVARSQKLISCSLFQSLPTLIGTGFGGTEKARYEAMTFIANHATKLIYANTCSETNQHFAELLPKSRKLYFGGGQGSEPATGFIDELLGITTRPQVNWHEQLEYEVHPSDFLKLRTGGVAHNKLVDAIWFQGGHRFANGKSYRHVTFQQEF